MRPLCWFLLSICALSAPALGVPPDKEIYAADDRIEVFAEADPFIASLADSVGLMVSVNELVQTDTGTYILLQVPNYVPFSEQERLLPCPDEPFATQLVAGFCTGFVVGDDLIATAGHCALGVELSEIRILFGYRMLDTENVAVEFSADQVYSFAEAVEVRQSGGLDHAILRTERPITAPGAVPLQLRREGLIPDTAEVGIIGHPLGLPLKIAFGPDTRVTNNRRPLVFFANFDASFGNSGSPVFNQVSGLVEGIYTFSELPDIERDGDCYRQALFTDDLGAQGVARSTNWAHLVPSEGEVPRKWPFACGNAPGQVGFFRWADALVLALAALALSLPRAHRR